MTQGDEQRTEEVPNGEREDPVSEAEHATGSGTSVTATTNGQQDAAPMAVPPKTSDDAPVQASIATPQAQGLSTAQKAGVATIVAGTARLHDADSDKPQELAAATNEQLLGYYINGLKQSSNSFRAALAVAIAGVVFFIVAVAFLLLTDAQDISIVSAIGGAIVEVIAGLAFYLYSKTTDQLDAYRRSMEQTQRFLLANSIALSLKDMEEPQQKTLATLVDTISQWGRPSSRSRDNDNTPSNEASRQQAARSKGPRQPDQ